MADGTPSSRRDGADGSSAPPDLPARPDETLDPDDPEGWERLRSLGHRMVDDVVAFHRDIGERPAWRPQPDRSRSAVDRPLPREGVGAEEAYRLFAEHVLPYPFGNVHPRGWGWVNGTGTTVGAFAEMLAAAMNSNVWGGEHAAARVEARVLEWLKELVGWPAEASGLLVSGGSEANLIGLAAARDDRAGVDVGAEGLPAAADRPVLYGSSETHNSVLKSASLLGLGAAGVRTVAVDRAHRMDVEALRRAVVEDRAAGRRPMAVVATAGTVNTGAVDPLERIAEVCEEEGLWLHVDGAFGAVAALSPALRPLLDGMERADSLAFDLHKWLHVPIEAAVVLVRDPAAHRRPFTAAADYLAPLERGVAAGEHSYRDLGPQLTRGFRAAKVWLSLVAHGTERYGRLVEQNVRQARRLAERIRAEARLELLAPVPLNVVCFRYVPSGGAEPVDLAPDAAPEPAPALGEAPDADLDAALDALNRELVMRVQESGVAVPSGTRVGGRFALRCAFTNHRTRASDLDRLVEVCLRIGDRVAAEDG